MNKVFVTGGSGLVGSFFVENYSKKYQIIAPDYPKIDLTKKETFENIIREEKPDVILHFAAYTDVSQAENQRDDKNGACWQINVEGTRNLVKLAKEVNAHFIHISTDYVFPGSEEDPGPHKESDIPEVNSSKLTWYGFTKAEAERVVNSILGRKRTILRLVYPVRAKYPAKLDYLRKPLSLFDQGKLYSLFNDQQVTITFINEACLALEKIINDKLYGFFHASTPDTSTPFELVSYLIEKAKGKKNVVKEASLDNSSVRYQKFGGLKVEETQKALGIKFSPWHQVIDQIVANF
ncbi:MAG: sugar nucleotide-binding protein [Patescibacteria group bacterium]